jgi:hypothetical protein
MAEQSVLTKIGKIRTPKGIAAFAYLNKPDTSFGKVRFRINVFFDPDDPEYGEFTGKLKKANKAFGKKIGRKVNPIPVKLTNEKLSAATGQPVGTPYMEFETKADPDNLRPVPVFDASAVQRTDLYVYGGDIVKVEANVSGWELPNGAGIKLYLGAVQLLKSNWKGGAGNAFAQEDEFLGEDVDPEADDVDLEEETFEDEEIEQEEDDEGDDLEADEDEEEDDESDLDPTQGIL